jgi:hypothetical protein
MPSSATLDRLNAIVAALTPIASVQRGGIIRAQDWNTFVGAVLDLARAALGQDQPKEVPPHTHLDQVTNDWLEVQLRARIESGALGAAVDARLHDLEQKTQALTAQLATVDERLAQLQARVGEMLTRELGRDNDVVGLHKAVDSFREGQADISNFRDTLNTIRDQVKQSVDLAGRLKIAGQPADLDALDQRLKSVEVLRDKLKTPTGDLLDATKLEARFGDLQTTVATRQELSDLAAKRAAGLTPDEKAAIEDRVRTSLHGDLDTATKALDDKLTAATNTALAGVDARVTRAVSDSVPAVKDQVLQAARQEFGDTLNTRLNDTMTTVQNKLSTLDRGLRDTMTQQIGEVSQSTSAAVRAQLDAELPSRLDPVNKGLQALQTSFSGLSSTVQAHEGRLAGIETRATQIAQDDANQRGLLQKSLLDEINRRDSARIKDLADARTELNGKIADTRTSNDSAIAALKRDTTLHLTGPGGRPPQ